MQGQEQKEMDDAQKQFYMAQDRPLNLVGTYLGMINRGGIPQGVPRDYMNLQVKVHFCSNARWLWWWSNGSRIF